MNAFDEIIKNRPSPGLRIEQCYDDVSVGDIVGTRAGFEFRYLEIVEIEKDDKDFGKTFLVNVVADPGSEKFKVLKTGNVVETMAFPDPAGDHYNILSDDQILHGGIFMTDEDHARLIEVIAELGWDWRVEPVEKM